MTQPASVGTLSKYLIGSANPPTHAMEYLGAWNLGKHSSILSTDGIRGTRGHPVERTRAGTYTCSGSINMNPGPADFTLLLPFFYPVSGILPTETLPTWYIGINRIAAQYLYDVVADKMTLKASQGQLVEMTLDVEGKSETAGAIANMATLQASLAVPYMFHDAVLTIGGTAYQFREFTLVIDNHLKKDRFMNSISRTDLPTLDRTVSISLRLPFTSDTLSLYDPGSTSVSVVLTLTNGASSLTMTMASVQFPTEPQDTPGREEILLPYNGIARQSGATPVAEIVFVNV